MVSVMVGNKSQQLLTAKEVAEILRVAPSTVYDAAARGDIPSVRPWRGRRKALLRFRRDAIEALIAGQPTPSVSMRANRSR